MSGTVMIVQEARNRCAGCGESHAIYRDRPRPGRHSPMLKLLEPQRADRTRGNTSTMIWNHCLGDSVTITTEKGHDGGPGSLGEDNRQRFDRTLPSSLCSNNSYFLYELSRESGLDDDIVDSIKRGDGAIIPSSTKKSRPAYCSPTAPTGVWKRN
jgi:hypothetical protein